MARVPAGHSASQVSEFEQPDAAAVNPISTHPLKVVVAVVVSKVVLPTTPPLKVVSAVRVFVPVQLLLEAVMEATVSVLNPVT